MIHLYLKVPAKKNKICYIVFWRVIKYIVKMKTKQEILFNFWLAEKIQKHIKLFFCQRKKERKERKANIYFVIGKTANPKQWWAGTRFKKGSANRCMGKIKLWKMENFDLILEMSNLLDMTYGSGDERSPPLQREVHRPIHGGGRKPFSPHLSGRHKDPLLGYQRAIVNGINNWKLIRERAVDEILQLGNKQNKYI